VPDLEAAHWNQDEYDRAYHQIFQARTLCLEAAIGPAALTSRRQEVRVIAGHDVSQVHTLDAQGRLCLDVEYGESRIDLEIERLSRKNERSVATLHWFRPAVWIDTLRVTYDVSAFECYTFTWGKDAQTVCVIEYDPVYVPVSFYVHFGRLLGLTLTPEDRFSSREATLEMASPGEARIKLDLLYFFSRWCDSMSWRPSSGDPYPVRIGGTFLPAEDLLEEEVSAREDPPFVPKTYAGLVDATDGNPYLDLPSTEPEALVRISLHAQVRLP